MQKDTLQSLILSLYVAGETIPGSRLGALLRARLPELMEQHGKLSTLIAKEGSGLLSPIGKSGYDTIYRVDTDGIAAVGARSESEGAAPSDVTTSPNLWRIFCNPKEHGTIWVRSTDRSLLCLDKFNNEAATMDGLSSLSRLSHEEVISIIQDFYRLHLASSESGTLPAPSDQYWRDWTGHLRLSEQTQSRHGLVQLWWSYHEYRVESAFVERLRAFDFSTKDIERCTKMLLSSRPGEKLDIPKKKNVSIGTGNSSLRDLAIAAIHLLSDDDIARLALPIGVVVDATSKTQK